MISSIVRYAYKMDIFLRFYFWTFKGVEHSRISENLFTIYQINPATRKAPDGKVKSSFYDEICDMATFKTRWRLHF